MKKTILLLAGIISCNAIFAQSWNLTGNAGTIAGTNFLGTTDARSLSFRVNNLPSGLIDFAPAKANTTFGFQALNSLAGSNNSAFGYKALFSNTGKNNTAVGGYSLYFNASGYSNVAIGIGAMYRSTASRNVVAIGDSALYNQTGTNIYSLGNMAVGSKAMYSNTDGGANTALGTYALLSNTTGNYNTAGGYNSMRLNISGSGNTAYGIQTLIYNSSGGSNTAMGYNALFNNTVASFNTAVGYEALYNNTGLGTNENTAVGWIALRSNVSGYYNTALGGEALNQSTNSNNTAVGQYALHAATTAYGCTSLGSFADLSSGALQNATAIGFSAYVDASNKVRIGATSVTSIGGQVGWSNFSDGRIKKNIKENVPGLNFINLLRPVTYNYDLVKEDELLGIKAPNGKAIANWPGKNDIEKINFTGFVAQDVQAAAKKINYDFSGIDNTGKIMALRYSEFVVPLVKSVQELSSMNDDLKTTVTNQQAAISDLQQQINELKAAMLSGNTASAASGTSLSAPALAQNSPNPFSSSTVIKYYLPAGVNQAQIIITDNKGTTLKSISLAQKGNGQITLAAGSLAAGSYFYSLWADGKKVDSKQMQIVK